MCVGLAARVVNVKDGTAVIDAGGAKRDVSAELLEDYPEEACKINEVCILRKYFGQPEYFCSGRD